MTTSAKVHRAFAALLLTVLLACATACSTGDQGAGGKPAAPATPSTHAAAAPARNLVLTSRVRRELLDAGAALNRLPPHDYTGLRPGSAYLAYDPASHTYWAGAALAPKPTSERALVSGQDDGSYLLFARSVGGGWHAADVGMAGLEGSPCPVPLPASVRRTWGWAAGACHPSWGPSARRSA